MLPDIVVNAAIKSELMGTMAWAARHGIEVTTLMPAKKILRIVLIQEISMDRFYLQGQFNQYKAMPPVWDWRDENWSEKGGLCLSPKAEKTPFGSSMFFVNNNRAVICAPFNRLAFHTHGGPHNNWGDPTQWITAGRGYVSAVTIGDMLQAILRDFSYTTERMA